MRKFVIEEYTLKDRDALLKCLAEIDARGGRIEQYLKFFEYAKITMEVIVSYEDSNN